MNRDAFLITGAAGCIGAWAVANLIDQGAEVITFDLAEENARLSLVTGGSCLPGITPVRGDIRDLAGLSEVIETYPVGYVVHLAALQVPFCQADPVLGSQVNVTGMINVLEAVRRSDGGVKGLAYASSVAVFGSPESYPLGRAGDASSQEPATLYGIYKQAGEAIARRYSEDWGVGSIGLRPSVVYGVGRDQGLTSDPTKAMLSAAAGQPGRIGFSGSSTVHHASDVARGFIAAARATGPAAEVYNVGGSDVTMAEVAATIEAVAGVTVEVGGDALPLPSSVDGSGLRERLPDLGFRALESGVEETVAEFRALLSQRRVSAP